MSAIFIRDGGAAWQMIWHRSHALRMLLHNKAHDIIDPHEELVEVHGAKPAATSVSAQRESKDVASAPAGAADRRPPVMSLVAGRPAKYGRHETMRHKGQVVTRVSPDEEQGNERT